MPPPLQHIRHNQILERLKNSEKLSITELAREWNTTTKTVQRDFNKLMEGNYGIVRAEDGKRFTMAKNHTTSRSARTAIQMLDSLSSDIGGEFYTKAQSALKKLQNHIESPFYTRIDVESISEKLDLIEELDNAILERKTVSFDYKPTHSDSYKHYDAVQPYKIIIFNGFWYLLSRYHNHTIKFYIKSLQNLAVHDETFQRDETLLQKMEKAHTIFFDTEAKPVEVTLLLRKTIVVYFERKPIRGQHLKKNPDGTAELTIEVTHEDELFDLMKKWLPYIRVLEPEILQHKFERILREYLI